MGWFAADFVDREKDAALMESFLACIEFEPLHLLCQTLLMAVQAELSRNFEHKMGKASLLPVNELAPISSNQQQLYDQLTSVERTIVSLYRWVAGTIPLTAIANTSSNQQSKFFDFHLVIFEHLSMAPAATLMLDVSGLNSRLKSLGKNAAKCEPHYRMRDFSVIYILNQATEQPTRCVALEQSLLLLVDCCEQDIAALAQIYSRIIREDVAADNGGGVASEEVTVDKRGRVASEERTLAWAGLACALRVSLANFSLDFTAKIILIWIQKAEPILLEDALQLLLDSFEVGVIWHTYWNCSCCRARVKSCRSCLFSVNYKHF